MRLLSTLFLFFMAQLATAQDVDSANADSLKLRLHELYTAFIDMEIREKYDSAYSLICQCYDLDSTQAEIIYQKAVYDHMRMPEDSAQTLLPPIVAELERAYAKDRKNKKYAKTLLTLYYSQDDTLKVCSTLEDLTLLDRTNEQYVSMLATIYERLQLYDKEIAAIDRLEQMVGVSEQTELARTTAIWNQAGEKKAKAYWSKLVKKDPDNPEYHIYMGKMLMERNQPLRAAASFSEVLRLNPDNDEVHYLYIRCHELQGKADKAYKLKMEVLNDSLASSELKTEILRDMLEEYEAKPNGPQQMVSLFKQLLVRQQQDNDITMLYSAYLQSQECSKDSIARAMQEVLDVEPTNNAAQMLLFMYYTERDSTEAVAYICRHAIKQGTDQMEYYLYLAMACYQKGDKQQAKDILLQAVSNKQFVKNTQIYAQSYAFLGQLYHESDSLQQCYAAYEECLKWAPDDDETLNNYAYYISVEGGDLEKAERMSRKSLEAKPDRGTYLDTYAWVLFKLGRYAEALKYINKALNDYGNAGGVVYEHAGDIYALNGDIEAAIAYWELAKGQEDTSDKLEQKIAEKRYIP